LVETDNIIYGPSTKFRWSYAAAKLMDEFTALAYHRTKKLSVIIMRLFNTIGPRQTGRYGMVIPRFVQQALRSEDITVYGDGSQSRTFTYVGDVVEAVTKLMECTNAVGEVVNIGGAEEIAMNDLAKRVKKLACSTSKIKFIPYDEVYTKDFEEMERRVPSINKIKKLIKWEPKTGLDDSIGKVIEFYRVHE
jgi:UDP-glucose 4-epimerase